MVSKKPTKKDEKNVRLRVVEALQDDAYKGIARIDPALMKKMGLLRGDIISIKGEKETFIIVDQAYPADRGEDIIRIDGITRKSAKTGIGELVEVKKAILKEAKKITIAPAQKGIVVQADPENLRSGLLGKPVTKGDVVVMGGAQRRRDLMSDAFGDFFGGDISDIFNQMGLGGVGGLTQLRFVIVNTSPNQPVIITENTEITLSPKAVEVSEDSTTPQITYEDIGGLTDEVKKVREMVELPLKHPEIFARLGIEPPKGVLLYGPPGTGKTLLARAVANESDAHFITLNGPEIMSKFYGESEKKVREIFEEAEKNSPAIIFIDEIDAIAPKREDVGGEVERRVVSQLLTMMDGLNSRGKVVVIGATNRQNALDPALRRPGRFDREVQVGVPGKKGRLQILKIHTRNMPLEYWDPEVARNRLTKRLELFEGDAERNIKQKENILKENKKHILKKKKELPKIKEELAENLEELETTNKQLRSLKLKKQRIDFSGEDTDEVDEEINSILSRRQELNEEISEQEKIISEGGEISELMSENHDLKEEIEILEKNKEIIADRQKQIKGDKKILDALLKDMGELKSSILKRGEIDSRSILAQEDLSNKNDIYLALLEDLLSTKLIDRDLMEEIAKESVDIMIDEIARKTHGFVGADLSALTKEAAMSLLRKNINKFNLDEGDEIPKELLDELRISKEDFSEALKVVRPSAMREVLVETPNIKWEDVGGIEHVKRDLKEAIEWPLKFPESFEKIGIRSPRGILLYGPPGTGKTLLAKAVAKESEANFIQVKGPELLSMWVGKSEEGVRKIFEKARQVSPCIIFFDEIDSLASKRSGGQGGGARVTESVLNQMLAEMDGIEDLNNVMVVGATNRPDMLDSALMRPGRFDRIVYVGVPEKEGRLQILKIHTEKMPLDKDVNLKDLADKTEGYTGADLESLAREAGMLALREDLNIKKITKKHFDKAMEKVLPSVSKADQERYKQIEQKYLRSAKAALDHSANYAG